MRLRILQENIFSTQVVVIMRDHKKVLACECRNIPERYMNYTVTGMCTLESEPGTIVIMLHE